MNGMKEDRGSGSRWREKPVHLWTPNRSGGINGRISRMKFSMNGMKEERGSGSRWRENAVHLWTPNRSGSSINGRNEWILSVRQAYPGGGHRSRRSTMDHGLGER